MHCYFWKENPSWSMQVINLHPEAWDFINFKSQSGLIELQILR